MLKVTVAGCGLIASKKHIPAFLSLKNKVKVVAVCDLNENLVSEAARRFNIAKTYKDLSAMLAQEKPDIVDICTPPKTHAQLAVEALEKGAHVLLEKPMAMSVAECDRMIEAASRAQKVIGVIHNQIFNPALAKAKELLRKGSIGDFLGVNVWILTPATYMTVKEEHWAHRLPGGVLGETGPHGVYLALAFLKNISDAQVYAKKILPQYPWSKFDDFRIILTAENGFGLLHFIYGSNQWGADVEIIGTKGVLRVDLQAQSVILYDRSKQGAASIGLSVFSVASQALGALFSNTLSHICGRRDSLHLIGISKFIESILKNGTPPITAGEGRETVRIMEMIVSKISTTV